LGNVFNNIGDECALHNISQANKTIFLASRE